MNFESGTNSSGIRNEEIETIGAYSTAFPSELKSYSLNNTREAKLNHVITNEPIKSN